MYCDTGDLVALIGEYDLMKLMAHAMALGVKQCFLPDDLGMWITPQNIPRVVSRSLQTAGYIWPAFTDPQSKIWAAQAAVRACTRY